MAQHPDISDAMLDAAARPAAMIHRRYIEAGGSESDWITDLSHLLAEVQHRTIDVSGYTGPDRRIPTPRPYTGPDRRASRRPVHSGL